MASLRESLAVSGQTVTFVETVTPFSGPHGETPMYAITVGRKTIPNWYVSGYLLDSDTADAKFQAIQMRVRSALTRKVALLTGV